MNPATPTAPSPVESAAMLRALELAGRGTRGANPLVGAVLLAADGRVLGEGFHRGAGTPHAEPAALADARARGHDPRGATMVVTLEPCNHTGRTGPCSEAIIDAGLARVVHATDDVDPAAIGGAQRLRAAGVDCVGGVEAARSTCLNERWMRSVLETRPFVTLKSAQSLDGRVAARDGSSQWITGGAARQDGHRLRAVADAVLVGTGTVLADDPRLTARQVDATTGVGPGPTAGAPGDGRATAQDSARRGGPGAALRVVMGLSEVPAGAAVRGEGFLHLRTRDVHAALEELYGRGVRHLLVEGGPRVASAFLRAGVVDEVFSYIAPMMMGDGAPAYPDLGVGTLADAVTWTLDPDGGPAVEQFGADVRLHLRPRPSS